MMLTELPTTTLLVTIHTPSLAINDGIIVSDVMGEVTNDSSVIEEKWTVIIDGMTIGNSN